MLVDKNFSKLINGLTRTNGKPVFFVKRVHQQQLMEIFLAPQFSE